jgi:hypothetical protein
VVEDVVVVVAGVEFVAFVGLPVVMFSEASGISVVDRNAVMLAEFVAFESLEM